MTEKMPFTQARVQRAIAAAQRMGLRVIGITTEGTVLTDNGGGQPHPLIPQEPAPNEWADDESP